MSFLEAGKKYVATVYFDDDKVASRTQVNSKILNDDSTQTLNFDLKASGGVAIQIRPE